MGYVEAVAEWIETSEEMPSLAQIYRATASLDTVGMVVAVGLGTRQRQNRQMALQQWADDGGRV